MNASPLSLLSTNVIRTSLINLSSNEGCAISARSETFPLPPRMEDVSRYLMSKYRLNHNFGL
ncbi:hypothetical protein BpHYR1_031852 [Brachionus plicatilis]|uniref:Uncharacterized protein n=1 Tax=Brachionus plicatilis TaxID=10195 RepID=A0A3M7PSE8_BRAPC|nr:hypothetical protein BpHYR1_031852 [Brachionus plicatilis]